MTRPPGQAVAAMYHGLELLDPAAERIEVPFGGAVMAGNLRKPPGRTARRLCC